MTELAMSVAMAQNLPRTRPQGRRPQTPTRSPGQHAIAYCRVASRGTGFRRVPLDRQRATIQEEPERRGASCQTGWESRRALGAKGLPYRTIPEWTSIPHTDVRRIYYAQV